MTSFERNTGISSEAHGSDLGRKRVSHGKILDVLMGYSGE